eukprot:sb/3477649/
MTLSAVDPFNTLSCAQEPTETSKQPIRTRYLSHVTSYQPIRDQNFLIRSVPLLSFGQMSLCNTTAQSVYAIPIKGKRNNERNPRFAAKHPKCHQMGYRFKGITNLS